jgi:hypothetical protein
MTMEKPGESTQAATNDSKGEAELQATSAVAFRKKREDRSIPKTVTLKSGNVITFVRKSMTGLMLAGIIPKDLATKILNKSAQQQGTQFIRFDDLTTTQEVQKIMLRECLVSPKLVLDREPNYEANEIAFDDLEDE